MDDVATFLRAEALRKARRFAEAEVLFRRSDRWQALHNLGIILRITGRLAEAEDVLRRALALQPGDPRVTYTLGMTLLQRGAFAEGFACYDARHKVHRSPQPPRPPPLWRGEDLTGKRILVVGEQGLGDMIMFARFLPLLAERAGEVVFVVPSPLVRLFAGLPARVLDPSGLMGVTSDFWISVGSVARWLGASPQDTAPLPLARPASATPPRGLGLMLVGGVNNPNPHRIPSAQVDEAIRGLAPMTDLDPDISRAGDLLDTARIIAGLEGVISVDTSVAHLAASMGKPTWILVPRPAEDWYTRWENDRTPWYPAARVLRQPTDGDWDSVVADLAGVTGAAPGSLDAL